MKPTDLIKTIYNTKDPLTIKSTDALNQNLDNSVFNLINDAPKTREGLLDLRQSFDDMVRKDYPNLYNGDMTPTRIKIQNMRETLNDFTNQKIPEGKVNGVDFRGSLMKQHNLLNAQDEMAQKFAREYPQGSTNFSRMVKAHPNIAGTIKQLGKYGLIFGMAYPIERALGSPVSGPLVSGIKKLLGTAPKPKVKAPPKAKKPPKIKL